MDYSKLQNGSDIRGVALEGIEGQHVNLTEQASRDIGRGFALWLMEKTGKKENIRVAVGRDSRLSGAALCGWLCDAMVQQGLQVTDFGMASTPAMFMATVTEGYEYDGTVMITASHLPFNRNGFKFFTKDGGLEKADIKAILTYASGEETTGLAAGTYVSGEFMTTYGKILADKIQCQIICHLFYHQAGLIPLIWTRQYLAGSHTIGLRTVAFNIFHPAWFITPGMIDQQLSIDSKQLIQ